MTGSSAEAVELTREHVPDPGSSRGRILAIIDLMVAGEFERGVTTRELQEQWGVPEGSMKGYCASASRHLELLGSREHVMQLIQVHAERWVREAGQDRVGSAKLLLETVGGITQQHIVKHELSGRSEQELLIMALTEIKSDPVLRAKAIAFLTADDHDVALLTDGKEIE